MDKSLNVFIWLAEARMRTEFITWCQRNNEPMLSYRILLRAMERVMKGEMLTPRQKLAEKVALRFRATKEEQPIEEAAA